MIAFDNLFYQFVNECRIADDARWNAGDFVANDGDDDVDVDDDEDEFQGLLAV